MRKSVIAIASTLVLTAGLFGGFALAQEKIEIKGASDKPAVVESKADQKPADYKDMIDIMKDNGFEEQAKYMENSDYEVMDSYMNNISDEDYNKMIDVMKDNGYGQMADAMQSIGKDNMIKMHNSMGGAAGMASMHQR